MSRHEHEFLEPTNVDADEVLVVYQQCDHAPIIDSVTDYERDETYYAHGPRCETTKVTYYELDRIEVFRMGEQIDTVELQPLAEIELLPWHEDTLIEAERKIDSWAPEKVYPDDEIEVWVDADHVALPHAEELRVVYRRYDEEVIR